MDTQALRVQHRAIITLASRLVSVAGDIKTRDDALDARVLILSLDDLLRAHLAEEDAELYPALIGAADAATRTLGSEAFQDMGGILGAWTGFREHWTVGAILADAGRFSAGAGGVLGALSLRIEMENDILYPALDRLTADAGRAAA